jgi:hypothetical protein
LIKIKIYKASNLLIFNELDAFCKMNNNFLYGFFEGFWHRETIVKTQILPFSSCHAGSIGCAKLKETSAAIFEKK